MSQWDGHTTTVWLVVCEGLAQCAELCWQLRGMAGKRQVSNARVALQHNIGLGGLCVVTVYRHGFPHSASAASWAELAQYFVCSFVNVYPLQSNRPHVSYDVWLQVMTVDYPNGSMLCCVWQLCAVICTHTQLNSSYWWWFSFRFLFMFLA